MVFKSPLLDQHAIVPSCSDSRHLTVRVPSSPADAFYVREGLAVAPRATFFGGYCLQPDYRRHSVGSVGLVALRVQLSNCSPREIAPCYV